VLGRYTLRRGSPAHTAGQIAAGDRTARARQSVSWGAKKTVRRFAGPGYERIRRRLHG
jgi:hypothetical protein